jgi:hypothetical protein
VKSASQKNSISKAGQKCMLFRQWILCNESEGDRNQINTIDRTVEEWHSDRRGHSARQGHSDRRGHSARQGSGGLGSKSNSGGGGSGPDSGNWSDQKHFLGFGRVLTFDFDKKIARVDNLKQNFKQKQKHDVSQKHDVNMGGHVHMGAHKFQNQEQEVDDGEGTIEERK